MRPFKMFFGFAIAIIIFSFFIRIAFTAFIIAAVMSIVYAIYRRVKDFVTYDRYGEFYIKEEHYNAKVGNNWEGEVEPLFYENNRPTHRGFASNARFIYAD